MPTCADGLGNISACQFGQFLVDQQPRYDKEIIKAIRPSDGWIGHVATGNFPAHSGTQLFQDRFEHVYPDTTIGWNNVAYTSCLGNPCDKVRHSIGWGSSRLVYGLEEQNWQTPLLCFDQMMHVTHAQEQWRQIINDILRPATVAINSQFLRKRALFWAQQKWVADANMTAFTYVWQVIGAPPNNQEAILCTSAAPTSLLTPQMLQRRVARLMGEGYFGKDPYKDETNPPLIELVTDMDTCWQLDHMQNNSAVFGNVNTPSVFGNWRFDMWDAGNKFWRYGFTGQLGNYAIRNDIQQLRFDFLDANGPAGTPFRYQLVLPYLNVASSGAGGAAGLRSVWNPRFDQAQFRMSFIWHKHVMEVLVQEPTSINPEMPFFSRNFGGRWQFCMHDLGPDVNGRPIENMLGNKGLFVADFKQAIRPVYPEFGEAIFHLSEPACIHIITPCNPQNYATQCYANQCYNDHNAPCPPPVTPQTFTPTQTDADNGQVGGTYEIAANSITCDGVLVQHQAITGTTTVAALVTQLNQLVPTLGVWSVAQNGTDITLTGSTCAVVAMPFIE